MSTKDYLIVSTIIFAVVAVMHLLRLVLGWSVVLGMTSVPSLGVADCSSGVCRWPGDLGLVARAAGMMTALR